MLVTSITRLSKFKNFKHNKCNQKSQVSYSCLNYEEVSYILVKLVIKTVLETLKTHCQPTINSMHIREKSRIRFPCFEVD